MEVVHCIAVELARVNALLLVRVCEGGIKLGTGQCRQRLVASMATLKLFAGIQLWFDLLINLCGLPFPPTSADEKKSSQDTECHKYYRTNDDTCDGSFTQTRRGA